MDTGDMDKFEHAYLGQWLETTAHYLFADQKRLADAASSSSATSSLSTIGQHHYNDESMAEWDAITTEKALLELRLDSHGAQVRFISRVRGRLLRLVKRTVQRDQNPLQELARAFYSQVSFVARNPDVPMRMRWLLESGNDRIHRRIRMMVEQYITRLSQIIGRAQHQGRIKAGIEPRFAAILFVSMVQGLALRRCAGFQQPEQSLKDAAKLFALYLGSLRAQAQT